MTEIENRNALERILAQACLDLRGGIEDPEVKKFLALRVAAYLRYVFAHLRSCLIAALTSGLLALIAVTAYAFEPKHFVSLARLAGARRRGGAHPLDLPADGPQPHAEPDRRHQAGAGDVRPRPPHQALHLRRHPRCSA